MSEQAPETMTATDAPVIDEPQMPVDAPAAPKTPEVETVVVRQPAQPDRGGFIWGTGRRKTAVARVRIRPAKVEGQGVFRVKNRDVNQYFTEDRDRAMAAAPLKVTETLGRLDVFVNIHGGGYAGQAGAVLLGLARALRNWDPSLEPMLREHDMLTRDAREVERKKYGQPGARRRFQFSKR